MPQAGVAVGAWVASSLATVGASTAVATTVGAIAAGAVTGAITGAVIGGVAALATGKDFFEGALKGAAFGAITGGLWNAGSMALSSFTGGAIGQTGAQILGGAAPGAAAGAAQKATGGTAAEYQAAQNVTEASGLLDVGGQNLAPKPTIATTPPPVKPPLDLGKAAIVAGVGQGLSTGVATVGSSMIQEKAMKEAQEQKKKDEEAAFRRNVAGDFERRIVNIRLPDSWKKYTQAYEQYGTQKGLLNLGV